MELEDFQKEFVKKAMNYLQGLNNVSVSWPRIDASEKQSIEGSLMDYAMGAYKIMENTSQRKGSVEGALSLVDRMIGAVTDIDGYLEMIGNRVISDNQLKVGSPGAKSIHNALKNALNETMQLMVHGSAHKGSETSSNRKLG